MLIHSIAPLPLLLPPGGEPPQETLPVNGVLLEGRRTPEGFLVSRLISTNPADYLSGRYAPGSLCPLSDVESEGSRWGFKKEIQC